MGNQIYSTAIEVDKDLITFLKALHDKSPPKNIIRLNIYYFHILISLTKSQNHQLSNLDYEFFNNLSPFKDKIFIEFYLSNGSLTPYLIGYECSNNKIGLETRKKLVRLFDSKGITLNTLKTPKPQPITTFLFD